MPFITLTNTQGSQIRVNTKHIVGYFRHTDGSTFVDIGGGYYYVQETPEQLDAVTAARPL